MTAFILDFYGRDMGVHAFLKGINLKVNVIAWLEFKHP